MVASETLKAVHKFYVCRVRLFISAHFQLSQGLKILCQGDWKDHFYIFCTFPSVESLILLALGSET